MEKKRTGFIVTIVILVILLLGLGGYVYYDKFVVVPDKDSKLSAVNEKYNTLKNKFNDLEEKLKNSSSNNYITYDNYGDGKSAINIYAIGYMNIIIYAYNGELYQVIPKDLIDGDLEEINSWNGMLNFAMDDNPTKVDADSGLKIEKLNIKESKIEKVKITNNFLTSDANFNVYYIYKDGHVVKQSSYDNSKKSTILKDYKVKDFSCSCAKYNGIVCSATKYTLTLQDGSVKEVTE